jgi:hypothetical protein
MPAKVTLPEDDLMEDSIGDASVPSPIEEHDFPEAANGNGLAHQKPKERRTPRAVSNGRRKGGEADADEVLQDLAAEIASLARAAAEGRLGARIDLRKLEGVQRKIAEDINQALNTIVEPIRSTAENAGALA